MIGAAEQVHLTTPTFLPNFFPQPNSVPAPNAQTPRLRWRPSQNQKRN
jgi:hypothetical protein